jgi:hypothetical protein
MNASRRENTLTLYVRTEKKKVLHGWIRRWVCARSLSRTNRGSRSRCREGLRALGRARLLRRCCAALDRRFLHGREWHGCVRLHLSHALTTQAPDSAASLIHFFTFAFFLFSFPLVRRGAHHASALLSLIDRFPRKNPRPDDEGVDMGAQLRLIRSRYKAMCASLGVRARLQLAPVPSSSVGSEAGPGASGGEEAFAVASGGRDLDDADADAYTNADAEKKRQRQKTIWPLTAPPTSPSAQDLSF